MTEKDRFVDELKKTGRAGVERVIAGLEELGFFTAPASTRFHGSVPGGLLQHSLNVYDEALVIRESQLKFRPELADKLTPESIAIAALLHDVCKAEVAPSHRWHMHAFDMPSSNEASGCFTAAGDKCPLLAVLIAADGLASKILETK